MKSIVTFTLPAANVIGAEHCFLVGEFNNWNPAEGIELKKQEDGSLKATVELNAGQAYQYRYLLSNGRWINDDGEKVVSDAYGYPVENCIIRVPEVAKKEPVKKAKTSKPKTAAKPKATVKKKTAAKPMEPRKK